MLQQKKFLMVLAPPGPIGPHSAQCHSTAAPKQHCPAQNQHRSPERGVEPHANPAGVEPHANAPSAGAFARRVNRDRAAPSEHVSGAERRCAAQRPGENPTPPSRGQTRGRTR
ncbi:hypothetical protein AAFF_G00042030 [Aldrovandia affinis]|uniref:Uncharacterized protein n=1 Tax=Aldrovandia affinis TaxID=143900 RepID=A0AAD7S2V0_9TELE|nr:hypothetical protein AAFF_G00042030 [Aldrovandia affinis]